MSQNIVLDTIRLGKSDEQDKTRFQQIQEERINRNFRRLLEITVEAGLGKEYEQIINELQEDVSDLEDSLSTLQGEVGDIDDDVGTLQTDVGTLQTDVGTLQTSVSVLGTAVWDNGTEISLATSTYKTVAQFTLPKGKWIIMGCVRFGMSSTGRRWCALCTSADTSSNTVQYLLMDEIKGWSDGSGHANTNFCSVLSVSAQTTYYLNAWQNSGSALSALGRLMAIRIT